MSTAIRNTGDNTKSSTNINSGASRHSRGTSATTPARSSRATSPAGNSAIFNPQEKQRYLKNL